MKRASMDSPLDNEEAKARSKYHSLEQDFLSVQKVFVSNKRKLQAAQRKKKTLLAEVKFLRQRHRWLTETQSMESESEPQKIPSSSTKDSVEDKNHGVFETVHEKPMLIPDTNGNLVVAEEDKSGQEKVVQRPPRPVETTKSCLAAGEKGNKRIKWQDEVVSRVEFF